MQGRPGVPHAKCVDADPEGWVLWFVAGDLSHRMCDADLLAAFEDASLPSEAFHHHEHVRVAWLFVRRHGLPDAIGTFSSALKRFTQAKGKPQLYHETITWAFLLLIGERLARQPTATWSSFSADNPDLLTWKPSILDRYYNEQTLWSDLARRTFIMPDRFPESRRAPARLKPRPPASAT
jgi:hypothetical protein